MKVLLWQTAYLGDVVLSTPLIRTIQKAIPDAEVSFVGRPFIEELLRGYPIRLIPYNKGFWESFGVLEKISQNHVAISPHISIRTSLLLFLSGIPVRIGFDRSELPWLYTHTVKHTWNKHEVERNLELLKPLGISEKQWIKETKLFLFEEEIESVKKKFDLPSEYVVLSPFSNFPLKEWHLEGWIELAKRLDGYVVVVGTKRDQERAKKIEEKAKVLNLVGKTSLRELMGVLALSKLVISADSSPVHIANAFGIPAISIYTSTSPTYGFYPLIGDYLTPNVECSPCSPNPKRCKRGDKVCVGAITPEEVLSKALRFL